MANKLALARPNPLSDRGPFLSAMHYRVSRQSCQLDYGKIPLEGEVHCPRTFCEPCEFNTVFGQDAQPVTGGDGSLEEPPGECIPAVLERQIVAADGQGEDICLSSKQATGPRTFFRARWCCPNCWTLLRGPKSSRLASCGYLYRCRGLPLGVSGGSERRRRKDQVRRELEGYRSPEDPGHQGHAHLPCRPGP